MKQEKIILEKKPMNRGKIVAIITGAISILIALVYLVLVQLLDMRGEMVPAPISQLSNWNSFLLLIYCF
jgi:hypothetical protein